MEKEKEFGKEVGHIHEGLITLRKAGMTQALWNKISDSEEVAGKIVELLRESSTEKQKVITGGVTEEMAYRIFHQPKKIDVLGVETVNRALSVRGLEIKIELTPEERECFSVVPFSEETLKMAAARQWRGKRAILWWAPPERYGITMLKLRDAFGTSKDVQPCVWNNEWWLKEKFAKEVLKEGWHLTLAELPDESKDKTYDDQKALLTKEEELLAPVEVMYLCSVNYLVNDSERLLCDCDCHSKTDTLDSAGRAVHLGAFDPTGLLVSDCAPFGRWSDFGVLVARKFD